MRNATIEDGPLDTAGDANGAAQIGFAVSGWGVRTPLMIAPLQPEAIANWIATCDAEFALIDAEIERDQIPFPAHLRRQRTHFPNLSVLPTPARPLNPECSDARDGQPRHASRPVSALHKRLERLILWPRISSLLTAVRRHRKKRQKLTEPMLVKLVCRPGPFSDFVARLRVRKMEVDRLDPGYGSDAIWIKKDLLVRPGINGFVESALHHPEQHGPAPAILVFLDRSTAADDFALMPTHWRDTSIIVAPSDAIAECPPDKRLPLGFGVVQPARTRPRMHLPWPRISLVVVSYNQGCYLRECLQSVLDQDYPNLECIVVDGGSTDDSAAILEEFRPRLARLIIEPDEGQSDALNKGFAIATGDIMNWLCSDDVLEPSALFRVAEAYMATGADVIIGGCVRFCETRDQAIYYHHSTLRIGSCGYLDFLDMLQFQSSWQKANYFFQPEVFFSHDIWKRAGSSIKRDLYYAMDYELYLRMALAGAKFVHISEYIAGSRVHELQKTQQNDRVYLHQIHQIIEEYRDLAMRVNMVAELTRACPQ